MKTKKSIKNILVLSVLSIASLFFINECFAVDTGKIIVDTVKLREEANTNAKVLELASIGEQVEILEEKQDWYKVKYKNITGYIRSDLVQVEKKDKKDSEENKTVENKVAENNVSENENNQNEQQVTENKTTEQTAENNESNTTTNEEIQKNKKYNLTENVKIKIIPLISAIETEEVTKGEEVEVIDIINDWVKVKTNKEKEGWIIKSKLTSNKKEEEVKTTDNIKPAVTNPNLQNNDSSKQTESKAKTMYVNSSKVNLREKADKTSTVLKEITLNTQVSVLSTSNGWAYVEVNGKKGYIAESLLSQNKQETSRGSTQNRTTTSTETVNQSTEASGKGNDVVAYARQFLGCKYVYGGTSTSGFDCSGFTQYVYKHFGVSLQRTAASQYSNGTAVSSLQAGDLVMFGKSGINHVGIYIGGNTFIHAANKSRGVTIDSLASGYYKSSYVGARRVY